VYHKGIRTWITYTYVTSVPIWWKQKRKLKRMVSSGMLHHVALVRTDVSEELSASFIRVTRLGELGTTLAVTSNRRMLRRNTKCSSETSVLTRATQRNIPDDTILHSHRHENLKSYKKENCWYRSWWSYYDRPDNNFHKMKHDKVMFLCKIWGFHCSDYEEWCLLGCYAMWLL
jgi:hypothetical protein